MTASRSVLDLIGDAAARLTSAERRVAAAVTDDPKIVAFGTVAQLAARSGTSGPTVLRFAAKAGFAGFAEMQAAIQEEIADQLRPATQRIRERPSSDVVGQVLAADLENVRQTVQQIDGRAFRDTVALLAERRHRVYLLAGDGSGLAVRLLAGQLDLLRDGIVLVEGNAVEVSRGLARIAPGDAVVVLDVRRYERWLLDATARASRAGGVVLAITDSAVSPLAAHAVHTFVVSARGVGPFDSQVGAMALVHALAAAVAAKLRRSATARLDAVEASWRDGNDLIDH